MATLLEMATDIVTSHASATHMSKEDLLKELNEVYAQLKKLESGEVAEAAEEEAPVVSKRKAFGKTKVTCMICGKEMKTLGRHIKSAHGMTPKEYRDKFDIPRTQTLAARDYSESRRQMAIEKDLGAGLRKAREARKSKK